MRLLFLCNTLYQLIGASSIREMFPSDQADLILSDHTTRNKKIFDRFQKEKLIFDNIYYIETKYLYEYDNRLSNYERNKDYKEDTTISKMMNLNNYDMFFCANAEPFSTRVVNYLMHKNKHIQINWFEDGLSAYSFDKCYFPSWKGKIKAELKNALGLFGVTSSVSSYYVFQPDKMLWTPKAAIKQIQPISEKLSIELGQLFDFSNCVDKYEEKYIFFEDGAMDWSTNADVELVKVIAEIVGKENIIVKIHPRNPVNRFKELGFKTNQDTSIPWEIIASNIDIENKVLISMYSQSVITPEVLLGRNGIVIALGDVEGYSDSKVKELFAYIKEQYLNKKRDRYYVPKNVDELKDITNVIKEKLFEGGAL